MRIITGGVVSYVLSMTPGSVANFLSFCVQDLVLRGFDQECREFVQQQYGVHGMIMHPENSPSKIEKSNGKLKVQFEPKKGDKWSLTVSIWSSWPPAETQSRRALA